MHRSVGHPHISKFSGQYGNYRLSVVENLFIFVGCIIQGRTTNLAAVVCVSTDNNFAAVVCVSTDNNLGRLWRHKQRQWTQITATDDYNAVIPTLRINHYHTLIT